MKTKKMISTMFASLLVMVLSFATNNVSAQAKKDSTMMKECCKMKDCCMMKDGKMMHQKDGKMMPMDKDMTMKNGTKCMTNGECIMKDGKKMQMKEGDCMDMSGKMDKCDSKMKHDSKTSVTYSCPMHPEETSKKAGKCSKCGMDMTEKK